MNQISDKVTLQDNLLEYTTKIVASHVSNNPVPTSELSDLIDTVFDKLTDLSARHSGPAGAPVPAVPVEDSVQPDYILCLEDGKKFKMLKKHLKVHHDMTPEEYRARWGLPPDYPMVAPNYAAKRQELARASGLGKNRK